MLLPFVFPKAEKNCLIPQPSIALGVTPPEYGETSYYHLRADSAPRSSPATCSASELSLPAPHLVPGHWACVATIKTTPIIKSIRRPVPPAPHHVSSSAACCNRRDASIALQPSPARKPATPRCHSTPGTIAVGGCIVSPLARAARVHERTGGDNPDRSSHALPVLVMGA